MFYNFRLCCLLVIVFFMSSCAGSSKYMKPTQTLLSPNNDKALVRFMRPSGFGFAINFNILDGEKVIGNSVAKSQFDYLADPGIHLFIATAENKAFIEAELEAGKIYYIITRVYPGVMFLRVAFEAVNKESEFWDKVKEFENTLVRLTPDTVTLKQWEESNQLKIKKVLSNYEAVWKEKHQWPKLSLEDGR